MHIVTSIADAFLEAKMKNMKTSVALYSVSSDVDGSRIAREIGARVNKVIASTLATAREPLGKDPQLAASLIQGARAGVTHRLLESASPEKHFQPLKQELAIMMRAYVDASCVNRAPKIGNQIMKIRASLV